MKLIIHELQASGLVQQLTATRNVNVVALRPHIYRHNFATGSLSMQVLTTGDVLIAESESVDIADIGTLGYFHGYVRFFIDVGLQKDETYKFKLVGAGGYSFDEAAYIGWANSYDQRKYDLGYVPSSDMSEPLDIEIWERKTK